jgi:DNA-binding MarR family transcriptional regulator
MDMTWNQLTAAVESDPSDRRARRLLDRIVTTAVSIISRGSRRELQSLARHADRFTRAFELASESSAEMMRYWYVGQIQMIAALCRVSLTDHVSNEVMRFIRSRTHAQRVLSALRHREVGVSELAGELGIDVSQLGKLIDKLEEHELVHTQKEDRTRWVRLTALGERAAVVDTEPPQATVLDEEQLAVQDSMQMSPADIDALTSALERVTENLEKLAATKEAIERLTPSAERFGYLADQLASAAQQASRIVPEIPASARPPRAPSRV